MTCQDRTAEFTSVVKNFQSFHSPNHTKPRAVRSSEVLVEARSIGRAISITCAKLEKLTSLVMERRKLFGEYTSEIQDLTQDIKGDLARLNKDIADLQDSIRRRSGKYSKHMKSHSNTVVVSLQTQLVDISKDFKGVLEQRTENLKHQQQRRGNFSASTFPVAHSSPSLSSNSVLIRSEAASSGGAGSGGEVTIDMDSVHRDRQSQSQIMQQQDEYIQERAHAMENIHSTIVELGGIFKQLAEMVQEQEETVMRIDSNVTETQMNVEAAHTELLKYFKGVTSNRWLMIKIFAVVVVFFIFFIVFFA